MTRDEIKSARKLRQLSQAALGQLVGLSASDISRIECGYRDITPVEQTALAGALGLAAKPAPKPAGMAKKSEAVSKPEPAPAPRAPAAAVVVAATPSAQSAVAAKPLPSGTDLNDPANFGVLPDPAALEQRGMDEVAFRARLTAQIARANTILHTPRVPAAVWRAWRQFEQHASALLRGPAPVETVEFAPPAPVPVERPVPVVPAKAPAPVKPAADDSESGGEPKGFTAMFVEVARETVPVEVAARISRAAELARQSDTTLGFMKHFRRIAEKELDKAALEKIGREAGQRLASPDRSRARRGRGRSSTAAK